MSSHKFPVGSVEMKEYAHGGPSASGNHNLPKEDPLNAAKSRGHARSVMNDMRRSASLLLADCCGLGSSKSESGPSDEEGATQKSCAPCLPGIKAAGDLQIVSRLPGNAVQINSSPFSPVSVPTPVHYNAYHKEKPMVFRASPEGSRLASGAGQEKQPDLTPGPKQERPKRVTRTAVLRLTPLDQIAPRIYVRLVFIFHKREGFSTGAAVIHLKERFHIALTRWPFLAGQVRPTRKDENRIELVYPVDSELNLSERRDLFVYQHASEVGGYTYNEHLQRGFRPCEMDKDVLSLSPEHPKPGESCPPVTLKVTELGGGLLVCFSTHHGIFDGGFIRTFLDFFANGDMDTTSFHQEFKERPSMSPYRSINIADVEFPEYDFSDGAVVPAEAPKAVAVIFKVSHARLKDIRDHTLHWLKKGHGGKEVFVSMTDVLSAIVWVTAARARFRHLSPHDETSFTTAADARRRLDPAFPPGAWGNVYTQAVARTNVGQLVKVTPNGKLPKDPLPAYAMASWLVRKAVDRVGEPDYIPDRIALADSLEDPTTEGAAFRKANRPDHAGLGCSVWLHMGADVDFGIPGTGGKADCIRKTWSANDGSVNIMPRRGDAKGDEDWVVLVALRDDDMGRMIRGMRPWCSAWVV